MAETTVTTCDYCGETIDEAERVTVEVSDRGWIVRAMKMMEETVKSIEGRPFSRPDREPKELDTKLDLHRSCYVKNYRPTIELTGTS